MTREVSGFSVLVSQRASSRRPLRLAVNSGFVFMDKETFDQISVDDKLVGDGARFMKESETVEIMFNGNDISGN